MFKSLVVAVPFILDPYLDEYIIYKLQTVISRYLPMEDVIIHCWYLIREYGYTGFDIGEYLDEYIESTYDNTGEWLPQSDYIDLFAIFEFTIQRLLPSVQATPDDLFKIYEVRQIACGYLVTLTM